MHRYLLTALLAAFAFTSTAHAKERYLLLFAQAPILSSKVKIYVDMGTPGNPMKDFEVLKGDDGKPIKFSSPMEGVNYMGEQGWEYVEAFALTVGSNNVYHFVMKREE